MLGLGIQLPWRQQSVGPIYGVSWAPGTTDPDLTRTGAAVGKVAAAGIDAQVATNDFDSLPIWGEMTTVTDTLGNTFVRIPRFYIRKTATTLEVSKTQRAGFYLPKVFWDFTNSRALAYVYYGAHLGSLDGAVLASKPNVFPLVNKNIVEFRGYAQANNAGGLLGYQQLDIHAHDVLAALFTVEFATFDSQAVMAGWTSGQYSASHVATVAENAVKRIIVANATADLFRVGQTIGIGTAQGSTSVCMNRVITTIDVYNDSNKAISFDGAAVNIASGNVVYNMGWKAGFSSGIAASSGCITANDGKYPCSYRGIESPWGDLWQWVDGVNINELQAWVCPDAADYQSNFFTSPYETLSYANHNDNGYATEMGLDPTHPEVQFSTASSSTYTNSRYRDYYYQAAGQRLAFVGGAWIRGSGAGLRCWYLSYTSSGAEVYIGGRLLKKSL